MNFKNKATFTLLIVLLVSINFALLACASSEKASPNLDGTFWKLDSYLNDGGEMVKVLPDSIVNIEFNDDQASGKASCNSYGTTYTKNGENISFGPTMSTLMMCMEPEGIMDQENVYLINLASVDSYQITGEQLTLFNSDGEAVLIYTTQAKSGVGEG